MSASGEEKERPEIDLAPRIREMLIHLAHVPPQEVSVAVDHGCVHLYGRVANTESIWDAERIIRELPGVSSVRNHLMVRHPESDDDLKSRIVDAIVHQALLDSLRIEVERIGSKLTLGGSVACAWEKETAVRVAITLPGVESVDDRIRVRPGPKTSPPQNPE